MQKKTLFIMIKMASISLRLEISEMFVVTAYNVWTTSKREK